jgi:Tol biopolymer transport system component
MYEMVSAEHPFRSDSPADTMSAILREDPPDPSTNNPNVTPGLERVIRHCLEKNPAQRFQSARDLAFQLETLSSGSGTMPTVETPVLSARRTAAVMTGLALLLIGALAGWLIRGRRETAARPASSFAQLTYDEALEMSPSIAPDGETFVFTRAGAGGLDIFLQRVNGRNAINLTKRCGASDSQPAFSPDGSNIAYRSECEGGGIFVMGATGESSRRVTGSCFNPSWSPDGKQLVCGAESVNFTPTSRGMMSSLWIVDVQSGKRQLLLDRDGVQPSWSPHGQRIAYWGIVGESAQRDLWTIDPRAKDPRKSIVRVTNDAAVDWNPVWSPDGQYLYFGSDRNGSMNLWRVRIDEESGKTRGEPEPLTTPAHFSGHYSISQDGTRLVFASVEQHEALEAVTFDPAAGVTIGAARPILSGSFLVFSSQVSPDGRFVAVTNRGGQEDLFIAELATGDIRQLTNDPARDRGATWSADGTRIYFYSQRDTDRYEIWSIQADGSNLTRLTNTQGRSVWYPAAAPDGKRLSFYNDENTYVQTGEIIEPLPPASDGLHPALTAWSPDGTMLAGELRNSPGIAIYSFPERRYRRLTQSGAHPVWLPGGREILYADNGRLRIVNIDSAAVRNVTTNLPIAAMSLSADGRTLVFSERRTSADIWMMDTKAN